VETGDYAPVVIRNLRVMMAVFGVLVLARIWDIELRDFAPAGLASRIGEAAFQIIVTLILASALWGIIKTAISRHAPEEAIDPHALVEGEGTGSGLSRLQTLLPLVRKFLFITLVTIVGMIIVSSLGIDIGPLLAGAGVVGITIAFGAQALVRDIVSGIFFLIDDAFRVGEYIDVGSAKGMVERISVRSLRLRHHLGQINTIPFGEIKHVTNYSRDWVIMKLELRVPLDTDLEKVHRLVKSVGQQMLKEPELADSLLQSLKSQGVHRMEPSAYVIRVKFMARPGEQFILRREVFRRLHETFREHGIRLGVSPVMVVGAQSLASATAAADAVAPLPPEITPEEAVAALAAFTQASG
jgi:moderate conductance mechanosensitive channel